MTSQILVFHTATMVSARCSWSSPPDCTATSPAACRPTACCPQVASAGLLLVAVAQLMGAGLTTEFVFGVPRRTQIVPEVAVFFGHWIGTVPWLWGGAGLTASPWRSPRSVTALLALLGLDQLVLGGRRPLLRVSPLQYMAGMVGPLWLMVFALAPAPVPPRGPLKGPFRKPRRGGSMSAASSSASLLTTLKPRGTR